MYFPLSFGNTLSLEGWMKLLIPRALSIPQQLLPVAGPF